jgi:acetyl esterase/lipase
MDYKHKYFKYKTKYLKKISYDDPDKTNVTVTLDPINKEFANSLSGSQPIYNMSPKDARNVLHKLQCNDVDKIPADITDVDITNVYNHNKKISLRIVKPVNSKNKKLPIVMYFHGGGWILGDKFTHDHLIRDLANQANAAIVFVNYSPSPEEKFPVAIIEAYNATDYISKNGKKYNLDTNKIAIVGDSVGGNMAIAVTILANEKKDFDIKYLVLFYPVTSANINTSSYNKYADGPWLSKKAMQWFWDSYEPDENRRLLSPLISPLDANPKYFKNFPSTLIITDQNDVLRDEGEQFANKLMQIGINVSAVRFLATMHDFVMLKPLMNSPASKNAILLAAMNLKRIFYEK